MQLSVVVVVYNMRREAARTLLSLSADYQRGIDRDAYEVIVVENGSTAPLDPAEIEKLPGNFRYLSLAGAGPSPAPAVNRGLREARGAVVGVMIDGARIATPGLLRYALLGARLYPRTVVATLGWYLGREYQRVALARGYDRAQEDLLVERVAWPSDGYRLYEIGTLDESCNQGWFGPIAESNALFLRRELWAELGGIDERFDAAGGGFVNLDTFVRACELPGSELVILLGEGTFHQLHGGVATNAPPDVHEANLRCWEAQYTRIRGTPYALPEKRRSYLGMMPEPAVSHFLTTPAKVTITRLRGEVEVLKAELALARTEVALIRGSRSFRLTAPLRLGADWARAARAWMARRRGRVEEE